MAAITDISDINKPLLEDSLEEKKAQSAVELEVRVDAAAQEKMGECTICLSSVNLDAPDTVKLKNCQHPFHAECIKPWFQRQQNRSDCPNCRGDITAEDVQDSGLQIVRRQRPANNDCCLACCVVSGVVGILAAAVTTAIYIMHHS